MFFFTVEYELGWVQLTLLKQSMTIKRKEGGGPVVASKMGKKQLLGRIFKRFFILIFLHV